MYIKIMLLIFFKLENSDNYILHNVFEVWYTYLELKMYIAEGLVQCLRSLPSNPEVPCSIPGLVEGWIFGWPFFLLKFTQLSILPGSVKWVPAYMDRFEVAARGAYICFQSAGDKLIIVKHLWACYMKRRYINVPLSIYFFKVPFHLSIL